MGRTQLIVLNTAAAADELLVNRGTTYSGRPSPHVAFDLVSDGQRMVFMGYNHAWRVRYYSTYPLTNARRLSG